MLNRREIELGWMLAKSVHLEYEHEEIDENEATIVASR